MTNKTTLELSLQDLKNKVVRLSDYRGKIVFLNFWASWCPPCRDEMPSMQKFYRTLYKKKYILLAINVGEDREVVKKFARTKGYTFPILLDKDGQLATSFSVRAFPTTLIINKQGKVVGGFVGGREWVLPEMLKLIHEPKS
jgi:thiol-disulfide isomerase/thioredoxin